MSAVKTKFTLHENYRDFQLGASEIQARTLIPYRYKLRERYDIPFLFWFPYGLFCAFLLIGTVIVFYDEAILRILLHYFGQETTATVTDCKMSKTKHYGLIPYLTYTYIWNDQTLTKSLLVEISSAGHCESYLNSTLTLQLLDSDPYQSRLTIEGPHSITDLLSLLAVRFGSIAFGLHGLYSSLRAVIFQIQARLRYPRLLHKGVLLEGEIIKARSYVTTNGHYIISILYGFDSPHGQHLTGWAEAHRDDLHETALPPVGAPVAVIYADDHAHIML